MADTTESSSSSSKPRPGNARLPSLNQLAARIGTAVPATAPNARPRLAANLLRSNSNISSTTAASGDSTAVIPPSTRPISPGTDVSGTTTPSAVVPTSQESATSTPPESIPAPIVDREEKLIRGYKNIPSLDAITERMRRAKVSDPPMTTDSTSQTPKDTPVKEQAVDQKDANPSKNEEHPLQHTWTLFHDTKSKVPYTPFSATAEGAPYGPPPTTATGEYEAGLTVVGEFNTVEGFCRYFNWLKPPSKLERNSNYHLFKDGIKPMWEDPANANGGKWVLTIKNNPQLLDRCWSWLAMGLVGEELDEKDEVCGAVVSLRAKIDRIQLWTRKKDDVEAINALAKKLVKLLDLADETGIGLEFQFNNDERPTTQKFLSIQASYPSYGNAYRPSPQTATGPGFQSGPPSATLQNRDQPHDKSLDAASGTGGAFAWRARRGD